MKYRIVSLRVAVAAIVALGAAAAQAGSLGENTSVELFLGGNTGLPGSLRDGPATLSPDGNGDIAFDKVPLSSVYDHRYTGGAELDYAVNDRITGFARAAYSQFDGRSREIGGVLVDNARIPIDASFADNRSKELDLGARYSFAPGARLRPFVGIALGASDLSASRAMIDTGGDSATKVELARGGTVFEQRIETGLNFSPMENFDVRLTAAASHLGAQRASDDPNLTLLGLEPTRSAIGARWDYPAEVGAVWHF